MDYRPLGTTGLQISALTLGTMTFGGEGNFKNVGATDVAGARRQIDMCLDAGVNLIDTADVYSTGARRRSSARRSPAASATTSCSPPRCASRMGDGPNMAGLSRHHIISGCEASLRRLQTDHIDLYQVHEWDGQTPLEETLDALQHLLDSRQGALRRGQQLRRLAADEGPGHRRARASARFVSQQIYYSLQERSAEYELIPLAIDQGLGTLVWSPLAGGLLSGKYRRGPGRLPRARGMSPTGTSRPSTTRTSSTTRSTCWWRSPRVAACPPPRSPWPGCSAGRASAR